MVVLLMDMLPISIYIYGIHIMILDPAGKWYAKSKTPLADRPPTTKKTPK